MTEAPTALVQPLVSVIIPCYNHSGYLGQAIQSVLSQSYKNYEIIIVDDGSADNTKEVAEKYAVTYVYQSNQGPSVARNNGIEKSKGNYIVFLDADDRLVPNALDINVRHLQKNPEAAFVSGTHEVFYESENKSYQVGIDLNEMPYNLLLEKNFIAMIAAVLFQRWIFEIYKFDTTLRGCEDYDLYLKIARAYPILRHTEVIAVYCFHNSNTSANYVMMLDTALFVLGKQKSLLRNETEKQWYEKGMISWKAFYCKKIYFKLTNLLLKEGGYSKKEVDVLKRYNRPMYVKFLLMRIKSLIKKILLALHIPVGRSTKPYIPQAGKVNMGDFYRTYPFSVQFGYDRGGPVDRYYMENFLQKESSMISGRVLEIGDNEYTLRYGKEKITKSDILHIDENNPKATLVGDLSKAPQLPDNSFDCIILTQTLHLIYDYKGAVATCYRILKPGGILLITVPGISHIGQDQWGKYWLWSFTDNAMKRIMADYFSPGKVKVETFGNVLVATAFLYGMGLPELTKEQMDTHDPHYQVTITVSAIK